MRLRCPSSQTPRVKCLTSCWLRNIVTTLEAVWCTFFSFDAVFRRICQSEVRIVSFQLAPKSFHPLSVVRVGKPVH
jgi:hypothetical protein